MWSNDYSGICTKTYHDLLADSHSIAVICDPQPAPRSEFLSHLLVWTADRLIAAGQRLRRSAGQPSIVLAPAAGGR